MSASYASTAAAGAAVSSNHSVEQSRIVFANTSAIRVRRNNFIRGQASCSNLRAASPKMSINKSVVCVSNVNCGYSVDNIRQQCKNINVRLLFCFDISRSEYNGKAFNLAFDSRDLHKVMDSSAWPLGIIIRP